MRKQSEITRLEEKILALLDEARDDYCCSDKSEFVLGKIYGYIEVLEYLLHWEGVLDEELLELERQYCIR